MRYAVDITPRAEAEIGAAHQYRYERSPAAANRWIREIYRTIAALGTFAGYAAAREAAVLGLPLRQRVFQSYRIVFSVDEAAATVTVHSVLHAAQRTAGESDSDDAEAGDPP